MDKEDREANVKPMGVFPKSEPSSVMYAKANELLWHMGQKLVIPWFSKRLTPIRFSSEHDRAEGTGFNRFFMKRND